MVEILTNKKTFGYLTESDRGLKTAENQPFVILMESNLALKSDKGKGKSTLSLNGTIVESTFMCRICHGEETNEDFFIKPCDCSGSLLYVHQKCLNRWVVMKGILKIQIL